MRLILIPQPQHDIGDTASLLFIKYGGSQGNRSDDIKKAPLPIDTHAARELLMCASLKSLNKYNAMNTIQIFNTRF